MISNKIPYENAPLVRFYMFNTYKSRVTHNSVIWLFLFFYLFFLDLDDPVVTVHQSIGEAKEQFYYERTVFLRCVANSNPPVRYSWRRGQEVLLQGSDKGVEIYEPFFTQVGIKVFTPHSAKIYS